MSLDNQLTPNDAFEREKWQADLRLRERELSLREREEILKSLELRRSRWTNPLVLAVLAATLAATGNAVVAFINGVEQRELERTRADAQLALERHKDDSLQAIEEAKAEATRILEVIKTNDVEKARNNLDFLNQAGLITNPKRRAELQAYLSKLKPGEGPALPSSTAILEGLGLNLRQIRAAQDIMAEAGVPAGEQAAKLIEIAERFKALQQLVANSSDGDPEINELQKQVRDAVDAGDLARAGTLLDTIETKQKKRLDELQKLTDKLAQEREKIREEREKRARQNR